MCVGIHVVAVSNDLFGATTWLGSRSPVYERQQLLRKLRGKSMLGHAHSKGRHGSIVNVDRRITFEETARVFDCVNKSWNTRPEGTSLFNDQYLPGGCS